MTSDPNSANYTDSMLPSFLDSVVSLIVRTSTDLPPDVRSAMKVAMAQEPQDTQSGQALAIIALLGVLAGHARLLGAFAKSNVMFELLAVLEDLKPKSAAKRRSAACLLMTLFNSSECCEQVSIP